MKPSCIRSVSIVVPVFNSESTLEQLTLGIDEALRDSGVSWEILFVNDGSRDDSWEVVRGLASSRPGVRGVNLMRNYGQHNALFAGIKQARHEAIVTMDDDLQHAPADIPKLLQKLDEGYDVVYGTPERESHDFWRNVASVVSKFAFQAVMNVKLARDSSAFRAFRAQVVSASLSYDGPFVDIDALLGWGAERFAVLKVRHDPRRVGKSNYTFVRLVTHALNMVTLFSSLPLRLVSVVGFAFTLFGLGVLAYVVVRYLIEGSEPGFPFLASIIAIFSGAQLFASGIIGEYLARTHLRAMGRPSSVVRETSDDEAQHSRADE